MDPETLTGNSFVYTFYFDNLLCKKVGDTVFWAKVFEGSNAKYGEMWDENMTVTDSDGVRRPLVSFEVFSRAKVLGGMGEGLYSTNNGKSTVSDFENFAGIQNLSHQVQRISSIFGNALNGDETAIAEVREFFKQVEQFNAINNGVLEPKGHMGATIFEDARIFDYFKTDTKGQSKLSTPQFGTTQKTGTQQK